MSDFPLAYHITFGTYGMRLHGDERGTVDRRMNKPGEPIIGTNHDWEKMERRLLRFDPVELKIEQRIAVQEVAAGICKRGGWTLHVIAGRPDHVHVLLSGSADGDIIRRLFKRWLTQALSERWPMHEDRPWWAEAGSVKWVWRQWYYEAAYEYVMKQRAAS